jgi:hypothetical protein
VSRWWTETVAALGDHLPLPLAALLLLLAAGLTALGWWFFPAWVPRRLPRLPRLRLPRLRRPRLPRWRRRKRPPAGAALVPAPRAAADDPPEPGPTSLADRLAAEGRYAEAVRERLRDMVRTLVAARLLEHRPGMTVVELTAEAARGRPTLRPILAAAGAIFSDLWYAQRPATGEHDRRMRDLAAELHRDLTPVPDGGDPS